MLARTANTIAMMTVFIRQPAIFFKNRNAMIKAIMQNAKLSAEDAMKLLNISPEEQQKLLPLL